MITVTIPGRPPGGNALHRMTHWQVRTVRAEWKEWTYRAALAGSQGAEGLPYRRAVLSVQWKCRTKRRRDFDNLISGLKPVLDGLVAAGVIADDSTDCLTLGSMTVLDGVGVDEMVLTVVPA